jgi:hypothetical protein
MNLFFLFHWYSRQKRSVFVLGEPFLVKFNICKGDEKLIQVWSSLGNFGFARKYQTRLKLRIGRYYKYSYLIAQYGRTTKKYFCGIYFA